MNNPVTDSHLNYIHYSEIEAEHIPDQCRNRKCVTLLSGHQEDTYFVIEHIDELKLYVKVAWFGNNLQHVTRVLFKQLRDKRPDNRKTFVVVHWTPSEITDVDIEYDSIIMPKCEQFRSEGSKNTMCKYELTPVLKYSSLPLKKSMTAYSTLSIMNLDRKNETRLLQMYNNLTSLQMARPSEVNFHKTNIDNSIVQNDKILNVANDKEEKIYNEVACQFIKENEEQILSEFIRLPEERKTTVFIGGIYPKFEEDPNEYAGERMTFCTFSIDRIQ